MTEADEEKIRAIVRDELLGIINDGHEFLNPKKDPMGIGRRALDGLADLIRRRQTSQTNDE
ncbi:MAG TPA: hypothetical protein VF791_23865 [Pyrinomonadaceae bacterium]